MSTRQRRQTVQAARLRRHVRIRRRVHGTAVRPRLAVFRSSGHIYCQVIDDERQHTMAAASDLEPDLRQATGRNKTARAEAVGARIAERAQAAGVTQIVFDRGGFRFHGRVKALAEAARKAGLEF